MVVLLLLLLQLLLLLVVMVMRTAVDHLNTLWPPMSSLACAHT